MRKYYTSDKGFKEIDSWRQGCWARVVAPDTDDYDFLRSKLCIPESFLEYMADNDEQPHIEREDGWLMIIIRIACEASSSQLPYTTVPLGIISGHGCLVTLCYHSTHTISDFIGEANRKHVTVRNDSDLALHLINSSAARYLISLRNINSAADEGVKKLRRSVRNEELLSMMNLQKSLVYFCTALQANEVMLDRLKNIFGPEIDEDLLEDVAIEVRQALDTSKVYSDILGSTMDTFASVISNNVNSVMKRMTSLSIALMVPTLIASFYGMNVDISLSSNPLAFWIIVAVAALLTALVSVWFRIIKWF